MDQLKSGEQKIVNIVIIGFLIVIIPSTVLHHFFPWVFGVPSNAGVPHTDIFSTALLELVPITAGILCFYHARKTMGLYRAMMFLGGSFFFTGMAENVWILLGRHPELLARISSQFSDVPGTYYFTRGILWWGEMPAVICLGWFFIAYACMHIAEILLPKAGTAVKAATSGFIAMSFDLWVDPVQVHPAWQSWKWMTNETVKVFSIPLTNFAAWFLLIFLFALAFERLPRITARWGTGRGTLMFFLLLIGLKAAMLIGFTLYGVLAMRYVNPPVNLTLWGI